MSQIVCKKELAPTIKSIEVISPLIAEKYMPGQFIVLRIDEKGERIPLTIVEAKPKKGTITLVFQEVGKTTIKLGQLKVGDSIRDILGPLGNPSEISNYGTVVVIGGGVGAALAYPEVKALKEIGNIVITIIGARTKDLLIFEKKFKDISDEFYVATDDGSKGHTGFVTEILEKLLEKKKVNFVYTVGPTVMMKRVENLTRPYKIKTIASLNPIMVDGTGMCGGCRISIGRETKFCCVNGPEFDAHLINFDELLARQKIYLEEEAESLSHCKEKAESVE